MDSHCFQLRLLTRSIDVLITRPMPLHSPTPTLATVSAVTRSLAAIFSNVAISTNAMQFTTVFIASITAIVTVNAAVLPVVNDNAEQSNVLESRSYNAPTDDTNLEKRSPQYGGNGYQQQNWG
ncbi:hypothetical protein BASA60_005130 [Batrachochytrium salamandrivorans]|nr:hypothetical protein BASA60_005130 [Batrachochytrium salamandrivorans]